MADKRISDLTALTGANVADTDLLPIVDTSATETKKITFAEFKTALDTATGFVRITGDTMTGDLSFGANDKAIFGANSDLQIFHNETESFIRDVGTGGLKIDSNGPDITLRVNATETAIVANSNGSVDLYYNNAEKLATTTTGIDVTGTVVADSLNVGTTSDAYSSIFITSSATGESELRMGDTDTDAGSIAYTNSNDTMTFRAAAAARMTLASTGIDVTGTVTADGLTVDSGSGANQLTLARSTTYSGLSWSTLISDFGGGGSDLIFDSTGANTGYGFRTRDSGDVIGKALVMSPNRDISFYEDTGTTAKFYWDAAAESLGIGTSSPSTILDVSGTSATLTLRDSRVSATWTAGTALGKLDFYTSDATGIGPHSVASIGVVAGGDSAFSPDGELVFATGPYNTASSERLRIDSSGNVNITGGNLSVVGQVTATGGATSAPTYSFISDTDTGISRPTTNAVNIVTAGTERMRINSDGSLLIGQSLNDRPAEFTQPTGASISGASGYLHGQYQSSVTGLNMLLNRKGLDGPIIAFRKDGPDVGNIGTNGGDLTIGTGDVGLKFNDASGLISPWDMTSNAPEDAAIDLGYATGRFKDLYLSGGVYLGGTVAANYLSDYEYGSFEPTYTGSTTNPSGVTYDPTVGNEGYYVKVGRAVFIQINIRTDAISSVGAGNLGISGLPFAAASVSGQGGYGSFAVGQSTDFAGEAPSSGCVAEGATEIQLFYRLTSDGNSTSSQCADLGTGGNANLVRLSGTYYSTA
jgi:hypothetical protein